MGMSHPAKLYCMGHVLIEHRNGLAVDVEITPADGHAESQAALQLIKRNAGLECTAAGDKSYGQQGFVSSCRQMGIVPHVAQNITEQRGSRIDRRNARHWGYVASQRPRKRIEEIFGWGKQGWAALAQVASAGGAQCPVPGLADRRVQYFASRLQPDGGTAMKGKQRRMMRTDAIGERSNGATIARIERPAIGRLP